MPFDSLGISMELMRALADNNYQEPYPIQSEAIPAVLNGKDILGIAETGSGKTASFVLPILMKVYESRSSKNRHPQVLVLVPTRELAVQVSEVFKMFDRYLPSRVSSLAVYGGVAINPQMQAMNGVEILIATPGRLLDLLGYNAIQLSQVKVLVLDEADKMLNLGFKDEMDQIFKLLPPTRQNLLFSATLSDKLNDLNRVLLKNPVVINVQEEESNIELITQSAYLVSGEKKGPLLRYLINNLEMTQVLVFTSSIHKADMVANKLTKNGIPAIAIHSKKTQGARTDALKQFKSGKVKALIATDLIARGIDIPLLPYVINYELPRSPKDFVHRIGRTGRSKAEGHAITFVGEGDEAHFKVIQKKIGKFVSCQDADEIDLQGA